jgi:hypothetical protein
LNQTTRLYIPNTVLFIVTEVSVMYLIKDNELSAAIRGEKYLD